MENLNDLKNGMDSLIKRMELELSSLRQARLLLNATPIISINEKGISPNNNFLAEKDTTNNSIVKSPNIAFPLLNNQNNKIINNINEEHSRRGRRREDIGNEYPINGKGTDKLRFILHSKNHAVSETEFRSEIINYEGTDAKILNSLDRILRGMSHPVKGEWTYFTFTKMGEKFFILPEWRDNELKTVFTNQRCDVSFSGLNPNYCNWNQLIWHRDK